MNNNASTLDVVGEEAEITATVLGQEAAVLVDWGVIKKGTIQRVITRDWIGDTRYGHLCEIVATCDEGPEIVEMPEIGIVNVTYASMPAGAVQLYGASGPVYNLKEVMTDQEIEAATEKTLDYIKADYLATEGIHYEICAFYTEEVDA